MKKLKPVMGKVPQSVRSFGIKLMNSRRLREEGKREERREEGGIARTVNTKLFWCGLKEREFLLNYRTFSP